MTSIVDVSSHLPASVSLTSLQEQLELTDVQVRRLQRFYGLSEICRTDESEVDALVSVAGKLSSLARREDQVRYLVRAKTVSISVPHPANPLREVREALGLKHATTFTLTDHACASGLLAVDVCGTLLAADGAPDTLALILLGEKTFSYMSRIIPDVAVLGEGVAAVLVGAGGRRDRMLGYATRTHGSPAGTVLMAADQAAEFRRIYNPALAEVIHEALAVAGLSLDDIDIVLPHNVNRVSWLRAAEAIGLSKDRIFLENVAETGHCFCADPFINYRTVTDRGLLNQGDRYLMVSVGLGSTFSAMVFEH
jgi:3-oxoacyl-[acyl-carrier-protein] synthase-3